MAQVCPHCGAASAMTGGLHKRRFVLICPRCEDRFYPSEEFM